MTTNNMKAHIYGLIEEIASAEKITRRALGVVSRDILSYVLDTNDIEAVNRLMGVLTPMNKKASQLYFQHFLPWDVEKDTDGNFQRFGKKSQGEKKVNRKTKAIEEWLADESNNIWTWADQNIEIKKKDFNGMISRTIEKALEGDERSNTEALTMEDAMRAVFTGGLTIEAVETVLTEQKAKFKEAMALVESETMAEAA